MLLIVAAEANTSTRDAALCDERNSMLADLIGRVWEEAKGAYSETGQYADTMALRSRLREALRELVKAWHLPEHIHSRCLEERTAALKKLEE